LIDLVPNHTSDQHPWFCESRSSRIEPKRHWYLWRDPAPGRGPPNNWLSDFGGSGWQFDARTGQYYYHAFLAAQPDLNWRNPAVRGAIHDVMRFWLRRGVDGFRVDVIWHLMKDEQFRDNPENPHFRAGEPPHHRLIPLYTTDLPDVHDVIAEMRRVVDEFSDRVLIGEIYLPIERLVAYYGHDLAGVHLPFNFTLLNAPWKARAVECLIDEYERALPPRGWPNWVLGNHDRPRIASRVGLDQARVAAMLLLTLRGTPTIYYGEEIGMQQVPIASEQIQDPLEKNVPGQGLGRDGARTPMQWDGRHNAGFSKGQPWLPLAEASAADNVEDQTKDGTSILNLYRRLIALRRATPALTVGSYRPLVASGDLLLFGREQERERILIGLNLGAQPTAVGFASNEFVGRILVSTLGDRDGESIRRNLVLRGHEGVVVALPADAILPGVAIPGP
jgi:alpha-glucosidase